jgi:type II secretory ATPase GspE/PulE/Tfp pilus assembly ATPase PilB-like protein
LGWKVTFFGVSFIKIPSVILAAALTRGGATADLRAIAVSEGMTTLASDGIRRAAQGRTSLAEVMKTVSAIYSAELGA